MFVHSADKLAEMRTKFHVIQAKLIMSVWCFTVHWCHPEERDNVIVITLLSAPRVTTQFLRQPSSPCHW